MRGLNPKFADINMSGNQHHILPFVLLILDRCPVSHRSFITGHMATSNGNSRPISAESLKEHYGCEV
jgi:hypothetical protein